jgi:hypothetical protein
MMAEFAQETADIRELYAIFLSKIDGVGAIPGA